MNGTLEEELKDALATRVTEAPTESDPWGRVSTAIGVDRKHRRARTMGVAAGVAAVALTVPVAFNELGPTTSAPASRDETKNQTREETPPVYPTEEPLDVVPGVSAPWNRPSTWPTRGSLAGDEDVVAAVRARTGEGANVLYAADIAGRRVALAVIPDPEVDHLVEVGKMPPTGFFFEGAAGAPVSLLEVTERVVTDTAVLSMALDNEEETLIVLAPPVVTSARISWKPHSMSDGTAERDWEEVAFTHGVLVTAHRGPFDPVRIEIPGAPSRLTPHGEPLPLGMGGYGAWCDGCTWDEVVAARLDESRKQAAREMGVDPAGVTSTAVFSGQVPSTWAAALASTRGLKDLAAYVLVQRTTLPDGTRLRTVGLYSPDARYMDAKGTEFLRPVADGKAGTRPLVLGAHEFGQGDSEDWIALVIAPGAATAQLVGHGSAEIDTTVAPVENGMATITVDGPDIGHYEIVTWDEDGNEIGRWPAKLRVVKDVPDPLTN